MYSNYTENRNWFIHSAKFLLTEKILAKGGLNLTESSISTERRKLLIQITKLPKKVI